MNPARWVRHLLIAVVPLAISNLALAGPVPSWSPTPTATITDTPTPGPTTTVTSIPSPTPTTTVTSIPSPTPTTTVTSIPSPTPTPPTPTPPPPPPPTPTPPTPTPTRPPAATIDLIWERTGTSSLSDVALSSAVVLDVVLTAGPGGSIGAGVSVDYGQAAATLDVTDFASTPGGALPLVLGAPSDTGSRVENINSVGLTALGDGLAYGESHVLGTITFHRTRLTGGEFEIRSDALGPTDGVLDLIGNLITAETVFNSAYLVVDGPTATPTPPPPTPTATPLAPTPTPPPPTPTGPAATIDLIWERTGTSSLRDVALSSSVVLDVVLTAGPGGSIGAGVSVDYGQFSATLDVTDFASTPGDALPIVLGATTDTGSRVENINSVGFAANPGNGLAAGESHVLGTITFHRARLIGGEFEIRVGTLSGTDGVLSLDGSLITAETVFNSAYLFVDGPTATPTPSTPTETPPQTPTATPLAPTPMPPQPTPTGPSATIDLIWERTGTSSLSDVAISSAVVLDVVLTAGPVGSLGAGVSVDYGQTAATLDVTEFASTPGDALPIMLGVPIDTGSRVENITSVGFATTPGNGLANGESHVLGKITFRRARLIGGEFEIGSDALSPTDAVLSLDGNNITNGTVFNSAYLFVDGPTTTPTPAWIPTATPTGPPPLPTPTGTPTATPTSYLGGFVPLPTPTGTPTATPSPIATATPTGTPTPTPPLPTPTRDRRSPVLTPPPESACRCVPRTVVPAGNLAVLRDLADGGAQSEQTRSVGVVLTAEEREPGACRPRESAESIALRLEMVDDDGDVILDETRSGLICDRLVGQQTFDATYDVRNCPGSVVPDRNSKGTVHVSATTEDGELVVQRTIECHR
jgi:hypothetical protein